MASLIYRGRVSAERRSDRPSGRDETEAERLDRNLAELLQELRVALPGVQVLFAFLLAVPFQKRFDEITSFQESIYFVILLATAISAALLIAPTAYHRLTFRLQRKKELVKLSNRLAIIGLGFLALAMTGAIVLITDFLYGTLLTVVAGVLGRSDVRRPLVPAADSGEPPAQRIGAAVFGAASRPRRRRAPRSYSAPSMPSSILVRVATPPGPLLAGFLAEQVEPFVGVAGVVVEEDRAVGAGPVGEGEGVRERGVAPADVVRVLGVRVLAVVDQHRGAAGQREAGDPVLLERVEVGSERRLVVGDVGERLIAVVDPVAERRAAMGDRGGPDPRRADLPVDLGAVPEGDVARQLLDLDRGEGGGDVARDPLA